MSDRHSAENTSPAHCSDHDIPARFRTETYAYELPPELIAQQPVPERDGSRLLVLSKGTGRIRHAHFRDLPSLLRPSDLLVVNETKVIPALLVGAKPTGGRVELLVVDPVGSESPLSREPAERECMVKSSKPVREGARILLDGGVELVAREPIAPGRIRIAFPVPEGEILDFLHRHGLPPLPPYIRSENRDTSQDGDRYQTIYATQAGSVAAPTAGLHFTDALLDELADRDVQTARIVLHVGPGTFTPVRSEDIREHSMEAEFYQISPHAAQQISQAKSDNRRIIAVGTTSVRTLESAFDVDGRAHDLTGHTDLFISPGYQFKVIDGMLTNFHLPCSTLLMLVCAFAGTDVVLNAYRQAVKEKYRFYSYGDACLMTD